MKDLFGQAILDYTINGKAPDLITWTSISEEDRLPVSYLFRTYNEMPQLEQMALQRCRGAILDVGCGAGSHSLYLKSIQHKEICAIDYSPSAIKACHLRGLHEAILGDVFTFKNFSFDTILLIMNGTGIAGTLNKLELLLNHLKTLLQPEGQILIDSSDIRYMFDEIEQKILSKRKPYYGELDYYIAYKNQQELPIKWLYVDFNTLAATASNCGLRAELLVEGTHFDYLAAIQKK